jgi:hypothetical protein
MKSSISPYFVALLLAACGPVYRTNYDLLPPASKEGQLCVNNVKLMSDTCVANCEQMSRSCRSFSSGIGVGYGYGSWHGGNYEAVTGGSSILADRDCSTLQCTESCLASARTAHLSCGGTIRQQTVCTANCPKPIPDAQ